MINHRMPYNLTRNYKNPEKKNTMKWKNSKGKWGKKEKQELYLIKLLIKRARVNTLNIKRRRRMRKKSIFLLNSLLRMGCT